MKSSARFKLAVGAALAATLGAKAGWTRDAAGPDGALFVARAEALLHARGFTTRRLVRPFATLVFASGGACTLMIGEYPPHGTYADALVDHGRAVGPLSYVWRGEVTARPPRLAPLGLFYVRRELRRIGFSPARQPIAAVAAGPGCALDRIDWAPLASLPS